MLDLLKSPSLLGDFGPNYVRLEWEVDNDGIHFPPTTHFIATIDDLTDVLDFASEDIDGMDDNVGELQEPPLTGRWTATSSYYIYIYIWWTLRRKLMATRQRRTTPQEKRHNTCIIGTTPNPATPKTAPETRAVRTVPKRNTTRVSLHLCRPDK